MGECFFLVPAYPGSPGKKAVKRSCVFSALLSSVAIAVVLCCFRVLKLANFDCSERETRVDC